MLCRRIAAILLALSFAGCAAFERRPPDKTHRLSRFEKITLGGWPQMIRIRGDDSRNPVLLFIHGGPGLPEMPVSHLNADLERDFVVVQWDQRGAGKSYRFGRTPHDMTLDRYVRDTIELSAHLRRALKKPKIHLAGFSWGALVGILAAERRPDLYESYIGMGQIVNLADAEKTLYREALQTARGRHLSRALLDLENAGPPPWMGSKKKLTTRWWRRLRTPAPNRITGWRYAAIATTSPVYTPLDYVRLPLGMKLAYDRLIPEIYATDISRSVPRLKVPAYFLSGRHDTVVSEQILLHYFRRLEAPRGKQLIWFEHSDHAPHLEEPAKYREVMRLILSSALNPDARATLRAPAR